MNKTIGIKALKKSLFIFTGALDSKLFKCFVNKIFMVTKIEEIRIENVDVISDKESQKHCRFKFKATTVLG